MPRVHDTDRNADVLVIGAGVVGLSTAVCLAEAGVRVRVDAADAHPHSTSVAAGAVWEPYLVEPYEHVMDWALVSLAEFRRLAADPTAVGSGVRILRGTHQSLEVCEQPEWTRYVDARLCDPSELAPRYRIGWRMRVPVIDPRPYLQHLACRLTAAGGSLHHRSYWSADEAAHLAPIVVNCAGIGARDLVPDASVRPVKGQLVLVENPGVTDFFCDATPNNEDCVYYLPQGRHVVLGGSCETDTWSTLPDPDVARAILRRCAEVEPRFRNARVFGHRAGLRPSRPTVRLEEEHTPHGRLVHNYGHGGAGFTLAWGCAVEIRDLVVGGVPLAHGLASAFD